MHANTQQKIYFLILKILKHSWILKNFKTGSPISRNKICSATISSERDQTECDKKL